MRLLAAHQVIKVRIDLADGYWEHDIKRGRDQTGETNQSYKLGRKQRGKTRRRGSQDFPYPHFPRPPLRRIGRQTQQPDFCGNLTQYTRLVWQKTAFLAPFQAWQAFGYTGVTYYLTTSKN
jgi:hypothetical protein